MQIFKTREEWLRFVGEEMRPMFDRVNAKMPDRFRATMSLMARKSAGVCYDAIKSKDHNYEIFIKIDKDDPMEVAGILAHELIHASVGVECKHKGEFKRVALDLGLEGKMTATTPGERFRMNMVDILKEAGPFPHASLDLSTIKKQTTRMHKAECKSCGYTVRVAAKWLSMGKPRCPNHDMMIVEQPEAEAPVTITVMAPGTIPVGA